MFVSHYFVPLNYACNIPQKTAKPQACIFPQIMLFSFGMKNEIHPTYYKDAKFSCACGNSYTSGSTKPEIHVEICSKCHPFYTGKQKLVDTAGIVDRFKKRAAVSTQMASSKTVKKPRKTSAEKKAK